MSALSSVQTHVNMSKGHFELDHKKTAEALSVMRALVHPLRLKMIKYLLKQKGGGANVQQIYKALKLEQALTSQHLRILREADLVRPERRGKFVFYIPNKERLKSISKVVGEVL